MSEPPRNRSERRAAGHRGPQPAPGNARPVPLPEDAPDVALWRERIRLGRAGHHGVNAYKCPVCGLVTVTIDVDPGVTPMFLGCRRTPGCTGFGESAMYPETDPPAELFEHLAWAWVLPPVGTVLDGRIVEHIHRCGLHLEPYTGQPSAYAHDAAGAPLTRADRPSADLDDDHPLGTLGGPRQ